MLVLLELMILRLGLCFVGSMKELGRWGRWLGSSCLWSLLVFLGRCLCF